MRRRAAIIGIGAGVILAAIGWLSRTPPPPAPSHAEAVARLTDTEAVEFTRRLKQQGEFRALRWLAERDRS